MKITPLHPSLMAKPAWSWYSARCLAAAPITYQWDTPELAQECRQQGVLAGVVNVLPGSKVAQKAC